jgi:hypothetical protein
MQHSCRQALGTATNEGVSNQATASQIIDINECHDLVALEKVGQSAVTVVFTLHMVSLRVNPPHV